MTDRKRLVQLAEEQDTSIIRVVVKAINDSETITEAAHKLGVHPQALHYHLRKNKMRVLRQSVVEREKA